MRNRLITNTDVLARMGNEELAIEAGLDSQLGMRKAYQSLVNQQREFNNGSCEITLFAMLTHYRLTKSSRRKKQAPLLKNGELLRIDPMNGKVKTSLLLILIMFLRVCTYFVKQIRSSYGNK